jgi:hypothetical protein
LLQLIQETIAQEKNQGEEQNEHKKLPLGRAGNPSLRPFLGGFAEEHEATPDTALIVAAPPNITIASPLENCQSTRSAGTSLFKKLGEFSCSAGSSSGAQKRFLQFSQPALHCVTVLTFF